MQARDAALQHHEARAGNAARRLEIHAAPSFSPSATWSRGAKSNCARRAPAAHLDVGGLVAAVRHALVQHVRQAQHAGRRTRPARPPVPARGSRACAPSASPSASSAAMSWPCALALPTALAWALRAARTSSAATCAALRRSSSARKRSTSSLKPRRARLRGDRVGIGAKQSASSMADRPGRCGTGELYGRYSRRTSPSTGSPECRPASRSRASASRDPDLEPARHRLVVARRLHAVGKVLLARGVGIGLVVRVAVALAVAERLHEPGRRIAQVQRHVERAVLLRVGHRRAERHVDRIALRRAGHEHHGLRQRELALGAAEPLVGLARPRAPACSARGSALPMSSDAMRSTRRAT